MKKLKAILALILVACLFVTLFAACAKNDEQPTTNNQPSTENNQQNNTQDEDKPTDADTQQPDDNEEVEITDVIFWVFDDRGSGAANEARIEAAMNKITEPEGVHVDISYLNIGDYKTKVQLAISGGERIDLLQIFLNSQIAQARSINMLRDDITDIYKEYAADALEVVAPYMAPYMDKDGTIYGLPVQRAHVGGTFWLFNKEVAVELGLEEKIANLDSYSELEEILSIVQNAYPDWYAIQPYQTYGVIPQSYGGDLFADSVVSDSVGDSIGMVYNNDGKIELLPASQHYLDSVKLSANWFNKGYVWPDGLYNKEDGNSNMKAKVSFAAMTSSEGSAKAVGATKSALFDYEVLCVEAPYPRMFSTGSVSFWGMGIPTSCQEPEAACKLLNMLYTNADLMNVFVHGEEGVDYQVIDGEAHKLENGYSEGNYVVGNNFLTWPVAGTGADHWEAIKKINEETQLSPFMGFVLDTSKLDLYIAQINAVRDQYHQTMVNGGYTPESYQEYLDKLQDADVQGYLDAIQTQLDAWVAAN